MSLRVNCPTCKTNFDFERANCCPDCNFNYFAHFMRKRKRWWKQGQFELAESSETTPELNAKGGGER